MDPSSQISVDIDETEKIEQKALNNIRRGVELKAKGQKRMLDQIIKVNPSAAKTCVDHLACIGIYSAQTGNIL